MMMVGTSGSTPSRPLYGMPFLLIASLVWAGCTLGLKSTSLSPIAVAIVLSYTAFFVTLIIILSGLVKTNLGAILFDDVLPFILIQGAGIVSTIGLFYAVNKLGSTCTLLLGSLSP